MILRLAIMLALLGLAQPAPAQDLSPNSPLLPGDEEPDPREKLEMLRRQLEADRAREKQLAADSAALSKETARLQTQLVNAAAEVRTRESELAQVEADVARLEGEESAASSRFLVERDRLAALLAILQRMGHEPPPALIVQPGNAVEAARSAMLLSAIVPQMREQATRLSTELTALRRLRQATSAKRVTLMEATAALTRERAVTARLLDQKKALVAHTLVSTRDAQQRVRSLAAEAKDLGALIARLDDASARVLASAPGSQDFLARRGALSLPVNGTLVTRFGEETLNGGRTTGIALETRAQAQVLAPADGKVSFAGPFLGYGQLLIIATGGGYHLLMSGLNRIDATQGQTILAGEPVGEMGIGIQGARPRLMIEVWRDGRPVDPAPWFADLAGKTSSKGQG